MKRDAAYDAVCRRHSNIPQDPLPLDLGTPDGEGTEAPAPRRMPGLPAPEVRALAEPVERREEEVGQG